MGARTGTDNAGKQNADGTIPGFDPVTNQPNGETFLGDFNVLHTFIGSPFGTDFFRIQGPLGCNIGGPGIDFIQSDVGFLEGQKYTTPIPYAADHRPVDLHSAMRFPARSTSLRRPH